MTAQAVLTLPLGSRESTTACRVSSYQSVALLYTVCVTPRARLPLFPVLQTGTIQTPLRQFLLSSLYELFPVKTVVHAHGTQLVLTAHVVVGRATRSRTCQEKYHWHGRRELVSKLFSGIYSLFFPSIVPLFLLQIRTLGQSLSRRKTCSGGGPRRRTASFERSKHRRLTEPSEFFLKEQLHVKCQN